MLSLLMKHPLVLASCMFLMFFTGLGQTFLIALFNPYLEEAYNISRTELSSIYSLATFLSALNLGKIGSLLDKLSLKLFATFTTLLLGLGLLLLGLGGHVFLLFLAFYLIRGFGQMTLGLIASTTISRYFGKHRAKALTLSSYGRSLSEGLLPSIVFSLITLFQWDYALICLSSFFVLSMILMIFFLFPYFPQRPYYEEKHSQTSHQDMMTKDPLQWSWKQVIKDKWPLMTMLGNSVIPFVLTGIFFQQGLIAEAKNIDAKIFAQGFIFYSVFHIFGSTMWGPLVDKYSAKKLQPLSPLLLILALIGIAFFQTHFAINLFMIFAGLATALNSLVRNTFWAEVSDLRTLGQIKGMDSKILVIGTSIAPVIFSLLFQYNLSLYLIIMINISLCLLASITFYQLNIQRELTSK